MTAVDKKNVVVWVLGAAAVALLFTAIGSGLSAIAAALSEAVTTATGGTVTTPASRSHRDEAERLLAETKGGQLDPDVGAALAQTHALIALADHVANLNRLATDIATSKGRDHGH